MLLGARETEMHKSCFLSTFPHNSAKGTQAPKQNSSPILHTKDRVIAVFTEWEGMEELEET